MPTTQLSPEEVTFIREAANFLEKPSFAIVLTNIIGKPLVKGKELLPAKAQELIATVSQVALEGALSLAVKSISSTGGGSFEKGQETAAWKNRLHTAATAAVGGVGGFAGLMALPIELPITTGMMLRSIASIANDFGQDINVIKTRLECLSVFAMGTPSKDDDAMESAYYTSRIAMSKALDEAVRWAAHKTTKEISQAIISKSAPALIQLIGRVAARYNVVVTQAALAKAVPGLAIVSGALINAAFTDYFNTAARYHFGIRALEDRYGEALVQGVYEKHKPSA